MKKIIDLDMDDFAGVLYAKVRGKEPKYSKGLKEDPELVISFDSQGSIVGAILLCASELSLNDWMSNPGRTKFRNYPFNKARGQSAYERKAG